ncbi:unnamed protein product, partial [Chrysoparadoxa australica]
MHQMLHPEEAAYEADMPSEEDGVPGGSALNDRAADLAVSPCLSDPPTPTVTLKMARLKEIRRLHSKQAYPSTPHGRATSGISEGASTAGSSFPTPD